MIDNIRIHNFKALKQIDISLRNINIFAGLNGMGKSTILQVFLLLRQSRHNIENELILSGELLNIGTLEDAFCEAADVNDSDLRFSANFRH